MDKYEYKVKTEQMLEYMENKQYKKAMEIADTIDWRRVKNVSMLNNVSEIYEHAEEYKKSREILFVAFDRSPGSKKIMYRLALLALKVGEIEEAADCYDEFVKLSPKDPNQYILKYKILRAQDADIQEQIGILEELKEAEYVERWAYELADLYGKAGMTAKCIEECDDLILWFSEGTYVYKAMELKMKFKPLTPLQQEKYDDRPQGKNNFIPAGNPAANIFKKSEEADTTVDLDDAGESDSTDDFADDDEQDADDDKPDAAEEFTDIDEPTPAAEKPAAPPIKTVISGASFEDAISKGVLHATGVEVPDAKQGGESDEELKLNAQMRIDDLLSEWENKQKEHAKAIEAQKEIDEERLERERKESEARLEAERMKVQKQMEEDYRRRAEQEEQEKAQKPDFSTDRLFNDYAEEEQEPEEDIEYDDTEDDDFYEEQDDDASYDDEFVVEDEDGDEYWPADEDEDSDDNELSEDDGSDDEFSVDDESDDELSADDKNEDEFEDDADIEEADDFEGVIPEFNEEDFEEDFGDVTPVHTNKQEPDSEEDETTLNLDSEEYAETTDFDDDFEDDFEEEFTIEEETDTDEEEDALHLTPAADIKEVEDDFEDDFIEDEEEYTDEDEADFEEYDDDFEEYDDEVEENSESESSDDEESEPEDTKLEEADLEEKEVFDIDKALEEGLGEPTEEEIQRRIKKSKGGVPFDTGFVVTGRYDLSATSEIGLKAGLTEEQKKLFSYFVPVRGMSEQIVEVLDNDRRAGREGTSKTGNILVVGRKGSGKTVLAVDIVKAIQKQRNLKQGKIAIVTGESLNKKELGAIFAKLKGGAIIIEKAGKLNSRTIKELIVLMEKKTGELLFVLEDQRKPLERILTANPDFKKKFTSKLELPIFINDELVTFGQTYAKENGYKLDEMGILALYSRIDALQREDHAVTVAEAKDIMDEAIAHSQKANVKHLARRVFGKSTDSADRVILKEEDFKI